MTTEEIILQAASKIFILKGMEGSRMQEIADEAGINKALLHYYFRSKENLFDRVFMEIKNRLIPKVHLSIEKSDGIRAFVTMFISEYIDLIKEIPYLPQFFIHEINRDPSKIIKILQSGELPFTKMQSMIDADISAGKIKPIKIEHLMVNMVSMILFPIVARPIIESILFGNDPQQFSLFLDERKSVVTDFVLQAIEIKNI